MATDHFVPVAKVVVGQGLQRGQGGGGIRAAGADGDDVPLAHAQDGYLIYALGVGLFVPLANAHVGGKASGSGDEAGRRAGMQTQPVAHGQANLFVVAGRGGSFGRGRSAVPAAELLTLHGQRALGLGQHLGHRRADHGLHRGGHGPLHQWSLAQVNVGALLVGQEIERRLRAQQGAAQIHQHDHAVGAIDGLDGRQHSRGVGADGVVGVVDAPGHGQRHAPLRHLLGQFAHSFGQLGAMRDDN